MSSTFPAGKLDDHFYPDFTHFAKKIKQGEWMTFALFRHVWFSPRLVPVGPSHFALIPTYTLACSPKPLTMHYLTYTGLQGSESHCRGLNSEARNLLTPRVPLTASQPRVPLLTLFSLKVSLWPFSMNSRRSLKRNKQTTTTTKRVTVQ